VHPAAHRGSPVPFTEGLPGPRHKTLMISTPHMAYRNSEADITVFMLYARKWAQRNKAVFKVKQMKVKRCVIF
jgi:hypothetical protein